MATNGSRRAATAPPVQRLMEVTTIGFNEKAAPAGEFAVRVVCSASSAIEFWRRGAEDPDDAVEEVHDAGDTAKTFLVADPATLRSAAACHGALRGMLAALPQLRSLRLAEVEWDAVVPVDVVPEIVGAASRGSGFTFCIQMEVYRLVIHDERALLMACKEWLASTALLGDKDCAICLHGLERGFAVQMTCCVHAFHRRCIFNWFCKEVRRTCPVCRGDVWLSAQPEILELSSTCEPPQGTTALSNIE